MRSSLGLGARFWIGLPDEEHHRVTRLKGAKPVRGESVPQSPRHLADAAGIPALAFFNTGKFRADDPASYRAEFGAVAGHQRRAGDSAPLAVGGSLGGTRFFERAIDQMSKT